MQSSSRWTMPIADRQVTRARVAARSKPMFKKILGCSDLPPAAAAAIKAALAFGPARGRVICALHVVPLPAQIRRWAAPILEDDGRVRFVLSSRQVREVQKDLENQVAHLAGGEPPGGLAARVVPPDPALMIASTADERQSDPIIVSRGTRRMLGRVAERVVRLTGRSVLVLPGKIKASAWLNLGLPPERKPMKRAAGGRRPTDFVGSGRGKLSAPDRGLESSRVRSLTCLLAPHACWSTRPSTYDPSPPLLLLPRLRFTGAASLRCPLYGTIGSRQVRPLASGLDSTDSLTSPCSARQASPSNSTRLVAARISISIRSDGALPSGAVPTDVDVKSTLVMKS